MQTACNCTIVTEPSEVLTTAGSGGVTDLLNTPLLHSETAAKQQPDRNLGGGCRFLVGLSRAMLPLTLPLFLPGLAAEAPPGPGFASPLALPCLVAAAAAAQGCCLLDWSFGCCCRLAASACWAKLALSASLQSWHGNGSHAVSYQDTVKMLAP